MSMLRRVPYVLVAALAATVSPPRAAGQETTPEGHWEGAIELPGTPLEIDVDLRRAAGGLDGDISIPMQGALDVALAGVEWDPPTLRFRIPDVPGEPTFEGRREEGTVTGEFRQSGQRFEFRLRRTGPPEEEAPVPDAS